jgi:hypothetical protein
MYCGRKKYYIRTDYRGRRKRMKCYFASSKLYNWSVQGEVCFANDIKEAKNLFWKMSDMQAHCDGLYFDMRVVRAKQYDYLYDSTRTVPYLVKNEDTLREMGWLFEGDEGYIDI